MSDSSDSSYSSEGEVACSFTKNFEPSSSSDEPDMTDKVNDIQLASIQLSEDDMNRILTTVQIGISEQIGNIHPMTWRQYLTDNYNALTNSITDVAKKRESWVLVDYSFLRRLSKVGKRSERPKNLICDIFIVSDSRPLLLLSIMTRSAKKSSLIEYNSRLARNFLEIVHSAGVENFDLVNGIFSTTMSELQQTIDRMESEAINTSIPHSLKMNRDRYKIIITSIMSMIDRPVERFGIPYDEKPSGVSMKHQAEKELFNRKKKDVMSTEKKVDIREYDHLVSALEELKLDDSDVKGLKWRLDGQPPLSDSGVGSDLIKEYDLTSQDTSFNESKSDSWLAPKTDRSTNILSELSVKADRPDMQTYVLTVKNMAIKGNRTLDCITAFDHTTLNDACQDGDLQLVKYILSREGDMNSRGQLGQTPIMLAAFSGHIEVFDLLLNKGADLSVVDNNGNTIIHVACMNDNEQFVKYLLPLNIADINIRGQWGRTPVMHAAGKGCRRVFDLLTSQGADRSLVDDNNCTILHIACLEDNVEFVKYLLTLNIADINAKGQWGRTPVMDAAGNGCRSVFDLLVGHGADLSIVSYEKDTILNVACLRDNVEFLKYLLTVDKFDVNVKGYIGRTPVMQAANNGCRKVFDLLVSQGADLSVVDDNNDTVLSVACYKDNVEFVKYLLTLTGIGDINARGKWGRTPVMHAAIKGCKRVFDLLVSHGANLSLASANNSTILNVACLRDNVDFVKYLLALKIADIDVRGKFGRTPVMQAANKGCKRVFDLLVSHGANLSVMADHKINLLHVASMGGNTDIVKYILSLGTLDINSRTSLGNTPAQIAQTWGNEEVFDLLVEKGCQVD